jgi:hypothetical protein
MHLVTELSLTVVIICSKRAIFTIIQRSRFPQLFEMTVQSGALREYAE